MKDEDPSNYCTGIAALPFWGDKGIDGQIKAMKDPVYDQLVYALSDPWYSEDQKGPHIRGRIYQQSYDGEWASYQLKAKRYRVSSYQWRAPAEWFAEIYATYYDPRSPRGSRLASPVRRWFERHVPTPSTPG
jgi:hypothetical protein